MLIWGPKFSAFKVSETRIKSNYSLVIVGGSNFTIVVIAVTIVFSFFSVLKW